MSQHYSQSESDKTQPGFSKAQPESNKTFKPVVAWAGGGILVALIILAFWSLQ